MSTVTAGKRERNKAQNRAAILAAGREVFGELGFGEVTVRDIVRRTDLASGTFYNYFPDKESVFRALVEEIGDEVRERVRAARREATDIESFVADGFRAYFEYVADDQLTFQIMRRNAGTIRTVLDESVLGPGAADLHEDLAAAIERGDLPPFDVEYVTAAMVGVAFEIGMKMVERDPVDVEGASNVASTLFLAFVGELAARH